MFFLALDFLMAYITFNSFFKSVFLDKETVYSIFGFSIQNEKVYD